jgi:hypothetical protein
MTERDLPNSLTIYPRNPDYGSGAFRRRVALHGRQGAVFATLDDSAHSLWCRIAHDGRAVTGTDGGFDRQPTTICHGAVASLSDLIGLPLDIGLGDLYAGRSQERQCVHLFDLAALAIVHARRGQARRIYEAIIPDQVGGPVATQFLRDGDVVLEWTIEEGVIMAPAALAGRPTIGGFTRWAVETFTGDELEAMLVFQKAHHLSRMRRRIIDGSARPLSPSPRPDGACYAYSRPQRDDAQSVVGHVRDFKNGVIGSRMPDG